jgi:hypothetical protein
MANNCLRSESVITSLGAGGHTKVCALPHEFAPLALQNKKVVYELFFRTSTATLMEVASNPMRGDSEMQNPATVALENSVGP